MTQNAITIMAELPRAAAAPLRDELRQLGAALDHAPESAGLRALERVHFMSFMVVDRDGDANTSDVILELNWDGPRAHCYEALASVGADLLDRVFGWCPSYRKQADKQRFSRKHDVGASAYYVGNPGPTVQQIKQALCIRRDAFQHLLQRVPELPDASTRWRDLQHGLDRANLRRSPRMPFRVRFSLHPRGARTRLRELRALLAPGLAKLVGIAALIAVFCSPRALAWHSWSVALGPLFVAAVLSSAVWAVEQPKRSMWRLLPKRPEFWCGLLSMALTVGAFTGAVSFCVLHWAELLAAWPLVQVVLAGVCGLFAVLLLAGVAHALAGALPAVAMGASLAVAWGAFVVAHPREPSWVVRGGLFGVCIVSGALALVLLCVLLAIRKRERADAPTSLDYDLSAFERQTSRENLQLQNHLATVSILKPGWLRRYTLRMVLRVVSLAAYVYFNRGDLGGIPTIHFARFTLLPDGKRLLFLGNYDGGFGAYLTRFCSLIGTTAIWSNTEGFPRAWFLVGDGAVDEQRFKAFGRKTQVETLGWWSAYPNRSVQEIANAIATWQDLRRPVAERSELRYRLLRALRAGWNGWTRAWRAPLDEAACDSAVRRLY